MGNEISGGGEDAREKIRRLLRTGRINGISVHIESGYEPRWGEPDSAQYHGIPTGNAKFAVCKAGIDVGDWLELQRSISGVSSTQRFLEGAYDDTVEWVQEQAEKGAMHEVPEPVLSIHYDEYKAVWQEGRSRGLGARGAGFDMIPIWIVAREYK